MSNGLANGGRVISKILLVCTFLCASGLSADSQPQNYPRSYGNVVEAAKKEKQLVVYSVVRTDVVLNDILQAFKKRYPFIQVSNSDDDAARTYRRFKSEIAAGKPSADFIWSPAMDLQEKLINDGFSQAYSSPEMKFLPTWAHWQDLGYGVTREPIVFVYNSRYLSREEMPRTHDGLRKLLIKERSKLQGRLGVYNPEKSEVGMLVLSQDIRVTPDSWNLFDALGSVDARVYSTSRDILKHVVSGEQWIGYNVMASYAVELQKKHPELVVVYPADYILMLSRVAIITANARHPNAAKLFLDFLLSQEGQRNLKNHGMLPVRNDVGVLEDHAKLNPMRIQSVRIGPGLLSGLDSLVRAQFLRRWRQARYGAVSAD